MDKIKVMKTLKLSGFTLIEVMVTMVVAVILIMIGGPNISLLVKNNRMSALQGDLISAFALARSTAVTRGNSATICASNPASTQCKRGSQARIWNNGWLIFNDIDNDGLVDRGEEVLAVKNDMPQEAVLSLSASRRRVSFDSEGSAFGFSSQFVFCDSRGDSDKTGLILSNSGRSRVAEAVEVSIKC